MHSDFSLYNRRDDFSIVARFHVLIPTYDAACKFVSPGALCAISGMHLIG